MSKVGIIDADLMDNGTRHPNLALMKISGYYKELGEEVKLIYKSYDEVTEYDRLFMSKVFNFTEVPAWVLELPNLEIGGTGFYDDHASNLPDEIEHHMPDYHLYDEWVEAQIAAGHHKRNYVDYTDFSIGFTTRGCFRKCSFCVNKKYDHVFRHPYVKHTTKIFSLRLKFFQAQPVSDALRKTRRAFQQPFPYEQNGLPKQTVL